MVDELGNRLIVVLRIGQDLPFRDDASSWHFGSLPSGGSRAIRGPYWSMYFGIRTSYLGRLAPYLERPWRRVVTPDVSSVPRTV